MNRHHAQGDFYISYRKGEPLKIDGFPTCQPWDKPNPFTNEWLTGILLAESHSALLAETLNLAACLPMTGSPGHSGTCPALLGCVMISNLLLRITKGRLTSRSKMLKWHGRWAFGTFVFCYEATNPSLFGLLQITKENLNGPLPHGGLPDIQQYWKFT